MTTTHDDEFDLSKEDIKKAFDKLYSEDIKRHKRYETLGMLLILLIIFFVITILLINF